MIDKVYIGIDPGKDGAMAIIAPSHEFILVDKDCGRRYSRIVTVPFDPTAYNCWLGHAYNLPEQYPDNVSGVVCVLEHVGAMPGQGSVSTFSFGENFGFLKGLLHANGISYELVRPQKWKKEFSCTSDKNTSVEVAQRLFPDIDLRRTPKCKGPHDGICEALLMAEYARRRLS